MYYIIDIMFDDIVYSQFAATELRGLRVAMSSFIDMALVSTKMLQEFKD